MVEFSVAGELSVNDAPTMIDAALAGLGLAYTFAPHVESHLVAGRLESCLEGLCPLWAGYHIYYPSRYQKSPALAALVEYLCRAR